MNEKLTNPDTKEKENTNNEGLIAVIFLAFNILNIFLLFEGIESKLLFSVLWTLFLIFPLIYLIKSKKHKIFKIISLFLLWIIIWGLNYFGLLRKEICIEKIEINSNKCLWQNINDDSEIIGFKEISSKVWNKWRWLPTEKNIVEFYSKTTRYQQLRIIHNYFQNSDIIHEDLINISDLRILKYSSFDLFFEKIIETYIKGGSLFSTIHKIWFDKENNPKYGFRQDSIYNALLSFRNDFLKTNQPFFDITIGSKSNNYFEIVKGYIEMKDIIVDTYPKAYGGYKLESVETIYWNLDCYDAPEFIAWKLEKEKMSPNGFKLVFPQKLQSKQFSIPDLIVPSNEPMKFSIVFEDGYAWWKCKIRFTFITLEGNEIVSSWYIFEPTSNPNINIYK